MCVKKFADHKKIHSKPIQCTLCQKTLLAKVNLNKHLRSHADGDKKECPVCLTEISTNNFKWHEISCLKNN